MGIELKPKELTRIQMQWIEIKIVYIIELKWKNRIKLKKIRQT